MDFRKLLWALRGLVYKPFFGNIGRFSYIGKPISIIGPKRIYIEDRVRIYPGVRMEAHEGSKIVIRNNTSIAQNVHIIADKESLVVGESVTVSGGVFITNIDHEYKDMNKHVLEQGHIVRTTRIGNGSFIGYGAAIQAGTILGEHCVVGTNAVVRGTFPDRCVIVGVPGRIIKRYNSQMQKWERVDTEIII